MQITLKSPCIITPRLMCGVNVDGTFISIEYSKRSGDEGRTRYHYYIDMPDGVSRDGDDLQSGCGGGDLRSGLESLLSFLGAAAKSYSYTARTRQESDNSNMFADVVSEWASQHSDEISMVQSEVEETTDCIVE